MDTKLMRRNLAVLMAMAYIVTIVFFVCSVIMLVSTDDILFLVLGVISQCVVLYYLGVLTRDYYRLVKKVKEYDKI